MTEREKREGYEAKADWTSRRELIKGVSAGLAVSFPAMASASRVGAESHGIISREPYLIALAHVPADAALRIGPGVEKLVELIHVASANGAQLLACGELWLPGYPKDINFQTDWRASNWAGYVANSMTVGDANWLRISAAARENHIHVSFGFSEIAGDYAYMSQTLIGNAGETVLVRRKIRPSGSERQCWSDDGMRANLHVATTRLGRVSLLECFEHLRPQSVFPVMAQLPNLHIAAWPLLPRTDATTQWWERTEVGYAAAAHASLVSGAVTLLPAVGYAAVFEKGVCAAEIAPESTKPLLFHKVVPDDSWTGHVADPEGEFSYGIARLILKNHPGPSLPDPEHA
ncbi:nitrilase (plasmid) [Novosphingobium sp. PP1Y]|nr:nitrilase [Novosphingobium sp. PP1Y]